MRKVICVNRCKIVLIFLKIVLKKRISSIIIQIHIKNQVIVKYFET